MNVVEMLQKQFQDSATNLQTVQRDYSKVLADRQTLDSQLNENRQVMRATPNLLCWGSQPDNYVMFKVHLDT